MTDEEIRVRCLEMATKRQGANDARPLIEIADEMYGWVTQASATPKAKGGTRRKKQAG